MQFGRKSEQLDHQIEQLELQLADLQADEGEAARGMPEADRAPRKKSVRKPLPDHLPRDEKVYRPSKRRAQPLPTLRGDPYFPYCSSLTFSIHSTFLPLALS